MLDANQENRSESVQTIKNTLRRQKASVVFLAILAILAVVLWILQFSARLNKPFSVAGKKTTNITTATTTDLHLKDSDGDSLSDYDEINVYHTSPYLEDSDSDSISDKQEVLQGTDPSCPAGKDCNAASTISTASSTTGSIINNNINDTVVTEDTSNNPVTPENSGAVTPTILRQILLQNGYDQATLDKISDADIIKSYQEAVKNQGN